VEFDMKGIYYDEKNDCIRWLSGEGGGIIRPVNNEGGICYFDVYHVCEIGGEEILDSHCNTLSEAMAQLEMVSL
jgi:hypothetical protein